MPRIEPLPEDEWSDDRVPRFNIFATLARHPDLFKAWLPFGGYLLTGGTLSPRDRELLILRTAVNCGSPYEWGQHVRIALGLEIDRETIDRVAAGPDAPGWPEAEALLLRAADELHGEATIGHETWAALADAYDERQLIEIPMLVGQYHMVAFALNSLGVEQDEGLEDLPDRS
jgi:4-carboxymuconolactone decarboxylase